MRRFKQKIFSLLVVVSMITLAISVCCSAQTKSKDGVTMAFYLTQSGSVWTASTYCYEDMSSMVSLFLYNTKGGNLLKSDCVKGHSRVVVPGTSVTRTQAVLSFTNGSAKYGRSSHALLYPNTNIPFISALELYKSR